MALPKVNESTWYDDTIPSTKQTITFRPFLVKEQKSLLIAAESEDKTASIRAILDTISACTREEIDTSKLTTFDVDYLFTKIRTKSVGESTDIGMSCTECEHQNEVKVDLEASHIEGDILDPIVKLTDDISVKMRYPNYQEMADIAIKAEKNDTATGELIFQFMGACMEAIMTEEENFPIKDQTKTEVQEFLDSLTAEQFASLSAFVQEAPKLVNEIEFTCEKCGHENKTKMEGMDDFF